MLATQTDVAARHDLVERLISARERTDQLFRLVKPGSLHERPIPERHRIIFYVGHLESFDWNLLRERLLGLKSFHPGFDRLFAFGIDPVGGGLPDDQPSDWPPEEEIRQYVRRIRQVLDENLLSANDERHSGEFPFRTLLNVAIEHRLMHAETLAYMLHQLPLERKIKQPSATFPAKLPLKPRMIDILAGRATLGLRRDSGEFGWDNEFEAQSIEVPGFAIDQFQVTNRQYLEFIRAEGYEARDLWSDDDWNWRTANNISHPAFWKASGQDWLYRGMFEDVPLPLDAPVYVSQAEAKAYARWTNTELPSEAEWHRAAYGTENGSERPYPWGNSDPTPRLGNFDLANWDPQPVNAYPEGNSAFGVSGLMGNGWEWTSTTFGPFPGFEPFPFYRGYSADFFDGKHFGMKGGSARTAACMLRRSFRNWFQSHYQYAYTGFRCVRR